MSTFVKGGGPLGTFGRNEFLRSTNPKPQTESYTVAKNSVPTTQWNGQPAKILQPGTAMAKITSGPDAGKIGPFQVAGTAEQQTITKSGDWTGAGGTYKLSATGDVDHSVNVPAAANGADVAALVATLPAYAEFGVTGTGGPLGTSPIVLTFGGGLGEDVPSLVFDGASLTGGSTPGATVAQSRAAVAGATDGRGDEANLVGLELTFLPWQLLERDVEVAVVTNCTAVQAWCIELQADGTAVPLTDDTADALRGTKRLDINFA